MEEVLHGLNMDTINRLASIADRFDHLESAAEWIAKIAVNEDTSVSQTATLILTLSDDIRGLICTLVKDLERGASLDELN